MQFEVYCDESIPDLFTSTSRNARYLMIGSLWIPAKLRSEIKNKLWDLRTQHEAWGEIKWKKISLPKLPFYLDLIDLFESYGLDMRFRCILVEAELVNFNLHNNDRELGFYKFYYQLLHHWISDFNDYRIFCDIKTNRDPKRLAALKECLGNANLSARILDIQALPSAQVIPIQLCDLLLGAASSRLNEKLKPGSPKEIIVNRLESHLGIKKLIPTEWNSKKFNIFHIHLKGGW